MIEKVKAFFKPFKIKVNTEGNNLSDDYNLILLSKIISDIELKEIQDVYINEETKVNVFIAKQKTHNYNENYPNLLIVEGQFFLPLYTSVIDKLTEDLEEYNKLSLTDGKRISDTGELFHELEYYNVYDNYINSINNVPDLGPKNLITDCCKLFKMNLPTCILLEEMEDMTGGELLSLSNFHEMERYDIFEMFDTLDTKGVIYKEEKITAIKEVLGESKKSLDFNLIVFNPLVKKGNITEIDSSKTLVVLEILNPSDTMLSNNKYFNTYSNLVTTMESGEINNGMIPFFNSYPQIKLDFMIPVDTLLILKRRLDNSNRVNKQNISFDTTILELISANQGTVD